MGAKTSAFSNDLLKLIFNGTPIANIADDAASSPFTDLTVALHTADPGVGGTQSTSEIAYTGYARQLVPRDTSGWTVTGNSVSPAAAINFPAMSGGAGGTATHWSVGDGVSNKMLYRGPIATPIVVTVPVVPQLTTASAFTEA